MLVMRQEHPLKDNTLDEVSRFPICVTIIPGFSQGSRMEMFISRYKIDKAVSARLSNMRVMFELIQQSDFIGSTSRLHKNVLPQGFRTMSMPNEIDPES
ncbi:transcriptional regulators LysR family [Vibrio variabilis]|uniref:Transcriptional regulators LysR family n=1 Tax=Vibrio variabilis TaxID=990271 RepID=A0ABQ0JI53_9VIBR|nr:transcriptional regulators LysR family [Vibrio variabilis]